MFRDYKRHYHKVKKVASRLTDSGGSFSLQIKFEGKSISAQNITPNQEEAVRLVVLMRRFLNPADSLYFRNVWSFLREHFSEEIPEGALEGVDSLIERMNQGYGAINVNGEDLTAENIYQTLSSGGYFENDEVAENYLRNIISSPIVGALFWHQFYGYTLNGFNLSSVLFSIILEVERSGKYTSSINESHPINRCIYCLTTDGSFTSEEHIIPESLGNDNLVLPKGYVCNKCNNEMLSRLDESLINFEPVDWLRVWFMEYTKAGKLPHANLQNMSLEKTHPRHIIVTAKDKTGGIKNEKKLEDGTVSFDIEGKMKKVNFNLLGRSLYKIALGMVALADGHEHACDSRFNAARDFIKHGAGINNNFLMRTHFEPHPDGRITPIPSVEGTLFAIDLFGLAFIVNLEEMPVLGLNEEAAKFNFESFSLLDGFSAH